jgi:hypothetical protein
MAVKFIEPKTDATMKLTVTMGGVPQTTAVVTVPRILTPSGVFIQTNLTLTHTTNGVYPLPIDKAWSTGPNGEGIVGWFYAEVIVVIASKQRTRRAKYLVQNASSKGV